MMEKPEHHTGAVTSEPIAALIDALDKETDSRERQKIIEALIGAYNQEAEKRRKDLPKWSCTVTHHPDGSITYSDVRRLDDD